MRSVAHTAIRLAAWFALAAALVVASPAVRRQTRAAQPPTLTVRVEPVETADGGDQLAAREVIVTVEADAPLPNVVAWWRPLDSDANTSEPGQIGRAEIASERHTFAWIVTTSAPALEVWAVAYDLGDPRNERELARSAPLIVRLDALLAREAASSNGAISGRLGYPSDHVPPLVVVARRADADAPPLALATARDQPSYFLADVPPGEYTVYAYVVDGPAEVVGAYTRAVPCGLGVGCTDHTPIRVAVRAGETTRGVDLRDWYAPPGSFPPRP